MLMKCCPLFVSRIQQLVGSCISHQQLTVQLNSHLSCSGTGICVVSGDPHYTTFDKRTHHYMGACSYTLTKPCDANSSLPYFTVDTQNEHRGSSKKVSYVKAVVVNVYGVTVVLGKGRTVQVRTQLFPLLH